MLASPHAENGGFGATYKAHSYRDTKTQLIE